MATGMLGCSLLSSSTCMARNAAEVMSGGFAEASNTSTTNTTAERSNRHQISFVNLLSLQPINGPALNPAPQSANQTPSPKVFSALAKLSNTASFPPLQQRNSFHRTRSPRSSNPAWRAQHCQILNPKPQARSPRTNSHRRCQAHLQGLTVVARVRMLRGVLSGLDR